MKKKNTGVIQNGEVGWGLFYGEVESETEL